MVFWALHPLDLAAQWSVRCVAGRALLGMESDRKAAPLRPTLRLSHPSKASEPKHGPEELEVRLPRRSEAGTSSNSNVRRRAEEVAVDEAAKGAASAAAEALQSVAGRLKEPLDGGLTATQVLEDPQTRAAAARWPAGSGARQLTAVLARALQGLQAWARWPARETDQRQPAPVRLDRCGALPVTTHLQNRPPGELGCRALVYGRCCC